MGKLVIVDDDELVRVSSAAILASLGHDILQAKDGLEALLLYKEKHAEINLIVMDVQMPRMDGISATVAIKEINPRVKVIMISGYTDQIPSCADAFLTKPFRSKDLLDLAKQFLDKS